jgi:S-methylmethionine-dependent homocysteine/selenocysteine methylase
MDNLDRDRSCKAQNIYILDGGMGHMIKRLGVNLKGAQKGSIERFYNITMTNLMNPEIVKNAHLEFLKAGCNIITTNNYAAVPKCLRFKHPSNLEIDVGKLASKDSTETTQSIDSILQETGFFENGDVNHKVNENIGIL